MTDNSQSKSVRTLRVGEAVRHALSDILARGDVHDDVLAAHPTSVTEVRMSPDLRHATVFVKPLLGRNEEAVLKALRTNTAYLQATGFGDSTTACTPRIFAIAARSETNTQPSTTPAR